MKPFRAGLEKLGTDVVFICADSEVFICKVVVVCAVVFDKLDAEVV